ncbi:MAG: peroxiredoxin [Mariniblastus sp.]|jgi:peroxiredoxin
MKTILGSIVVCLALCILGGCGDAKPSDDEGVSAANGSSLNSNGTSKGSMISSNPAAVVFKDQVESNVPEPPAEMGDLVFTDKNGQKIAIKDYKGKQNIVLVFTEGYNGTLCPFCQTQTSRLIANYDEFKKLDTEIIVVYPGKRDHVDDFIESALKTEKHQVDQVPFPIVLDEDFVATDFFNIHSMHAHPSTFLIDKNGSVQLAYVGQDMTADRPSIKAILEKIKRVN